MSGALWDSVWDPERNQADWAAAVTGGGLESSDDLGTAIILCLFTNKKLKEDMVDGVSFTIEDVVEWHGNLFGVEESEDDLGSYLWTLERATCDERTAQLARHYAADGVQTLVRQKRVTHFEIETEVLKSEGRINMRVTAFLPSGTKRDFFADLFPLQ